MESMTQVGSRILSVVDECNFELVRATINSRSLCLSQSLSVSLFLCLSVSLCLSSLRARARACVCVCVCVCVKRLNTDIALPFPSGPWPSANHWCPARVHWNSKDHSRSGQGERQSDPRLQRGLRQRADSGNAHPHTHTYTHTHTHTLNYFPPVCLQIVVVYPRFHDRLQADVKENHRQRVNIMGNIILAEFRHIHEVRCCLFVCLFVCWFVFICLVLCFFLLFFFCLVVCFFVCCLFIAFSDTIAVAEHHCRFQEHPPWICRATSCTPPSCKFLALMFFTPPFLYLFIFFFCTQQTFRFPGRWALGLCSPWGAVNPPRQCCRCWFAPFPCLLLLLLSAHLR